MPFNDPPQDGASNYSISFTAEGNISVYLMLGNPGGDEAPTDALFLDLMEHLQAWPGRLHGSNVIGEKLPFRRITAQPVDMDPPPDPPEEEPEGNELAAEPVTPE